MPDPWALHSCCWRAALEQLNAWRRWGLRCQHDLPGVGENLQDHLQLRRAGALRLLDGDFRLTDGMGRDFWAGFSGNCSFFRVSRESRVSIGSLVPFLNLSTFQAQVSRARADPELRSGELGEVRGRRRCSLAGCPAEPHSLALRLGIFDAAEGAGVHGGVAGLRLCELGDEPGGRCKVVPHS